MVGLGVLGLATAAAGLWLWRVVYWHVKMPDPVSDTHPARERF